MFSEWTARIWFQSTNCKTTENKQLCVVLGWFLRSSAYCLLYLSPKKEGVDNYLWSHSPYHSFPFRSDEWLPLETSALEHFYCGQFTLPTQFIKPNHLVVLFPLLSRTGVNWILVTKLTTLRSGNSAGDEKETTNILDEFRARHRCNFQQVGSREREATHILSFSPLA